MSTLLGEVPDLGIVGREGFPAKWGKGDCVKVVVFICVHHMPWLDIVRTIAIVVIAVAAVVDLWLIKWPERSEGRPRGMGFQEIEDIQITRTVVQREI